MGFDAKANLLSATQSFAAVCALASAASGQTLDFQSGPRIGGYAAGAGITGLRSDPVTDSLIPQVEMQRFFEVTPSPHDGNIGAVLDAARQGTGGITIQTFDRAVGEVLTESGTVEIVDILDALPHLPDSAETDARNGLARWFFQSDAGALPDIQSAAEAGDDYSQIVLGRMLATGIGIGVDPRRAAGLLEEAGLSPTPWIEATAKIDLASLYRQGRGVARDLSRADDLLREASAADPSALPTYIDFLSRDRGLTANATEVANAIDQAANAGNGSALFWQFERAAPGERERILDQIRALEEPGYERFVGDAELMTGNIAEAFNAYSRASQFDPYALGQAGILALDNPELGLLTQEEARSAVGRSAALGSPNGIARSLDFIEDPDARADMALNGLESDPQGRFREEFEAILNAECALSEAHCQPTPIWYVTNRAFDEDQQSFGSAFSEETTSGLATTLVRTVRDGEPVTLSNTARILCATPVANCTFRAELTVGDPDIAPVQSAPSDLFSELAREAAARGIDDVVVYIHGFNNTFDVAAARFATIMNRGQIEAVPVLMSWPSAGNLLFTTARNPLSVNAYHHDRQAAERSCDAMRDALGQLVGIFGSDNVHVLAHSMGNYLLTLMANGCGVDDARFVADNFKSIVMAAPDVGVEEFAQILPEFRQTTEHLTLYVTANDFALKQSADLVHRERRLGQGGSDAFVDELSITIDSSHLEGSPDDDFVKHGHVFDVLEARRDLGLLLAGFFDTRRPRCLDRVVAGRNGFALTPVSC